MIKSSTRENDAMKRQGKREMYEAAASMTQFTSLQQILTFFYK